jgi:hypothetical protein
MRRKQDCRNLYAESRGGDKERYIGRKLRGARYIFLKMKIVGLVRLVAILGVI